MSKSKKVATPVADRGWAVFGEAAYAEPVVIATPTGVTVNQGRLGSDPTKVVKKEDRVSKPARKVKKVAMTLVNGKVDLEKVLQKEPRVKKEKVKKEVALKKFSVKVTMVQTVVVEVEATSRKEAKMMVKQLEDVKVDASKSTVRKFRVLRDTK